jgi:hypothetical protein
MCILIYRPSSTSHIEEEPSKKHWRDAETQEDKSIKDKSGNSIKRQRKNERKEGGARMVYGNIFKRPGCEKKRVMLGALSLARGRFVLKEQRTKTLSLSRGHMILQSMLAFQGAYVLLRVSQRLMAAKAAVTAATKVAVNQTVATKAAAVATKEAAVATKAATVATKAAAVATRAAAVTPTVITVRPILIVI